MCSLGSSSDLSPPPSSEGAREPCGAGASAQGKRREPGGPDAAAAEGMECAPQTLQPPAAPGNPPPTSPSIHQRRGHRGVLGKIRTSLTNRSSYSTSEEGHSSDCEDTDDKLHPQDEGQSEETCDNLQAPPGDLPKGRSTSTSFAGRVRDLHRDVKRRISKLRGGTTPRTPSDSEAGCREGDSSSGILQAGSSLESLPSGCSGGSRTSLQGQTPTSSNRSSSSAGEDEGAAGVGYLVTGPVLSRARALVDVTPSPYDRDALGFKKGDMIDIIAKNKTGTWVGVLHGKVGHFKFINVEEVPDALRGHRSRTPRSSQQPLSRPKSLEQLLEQNGLQECINVLMLHGYEDLEAFGEISREDLSTLGISDPAVQRLLLRAADMLHTDEQEDDCLAEEWTDSEKITISNYSADERILSEESTFRRQDDVPINDLDAMDGCSNTITLNGMTSGERTSSELRGHSDQPAESFQPNISGAEESTVSLLRTTAQILKQSTEGCSISYPMWREDLQPTQENGCHGGVKGPPPPVPLRTTPSRPSKLANGLSGGGLYFAVADMTDVVGEEARSSTLPRQKSVQNEESAFHKSDRKLYKKLTHRKGSIQQQPQAGNKNKFPRPPSLSLLTAVCRKLEDEDIDLGQEPYTDKTGFCGIPPALVQRYAEELQRDVYDVAEAMDQARINSLQIRGRRGVPNDFLADSCYGPVVEANYRGLHEWLVSLGLPMYEQELAAAGFQHLARVAGLRDSDLCAAGVRNARHVRLLTTAIGALNIHFGRLLCP